MFKSKICTRFTPRKINIFKNSHKGYNIFRYIWFRFIRVNFNSYKYSTLVVISSTRFYFRISSFISNQDIRRVCTSQGGRKKEVNTKMDWTSRDWLWYHQELLIPSLLLISPGHSLRTSQFHFGTTDSSSIGMWNRPWIVTIQNHSVAVQNHQYKINQFDKKVLREWEF